MEGIKKTSCVSLKGWRKVDSDHIWSIGKEAYINFKYKKGVHTFYLFFEVAGFIVPNKLDEQAVEISVNDVFQGKWLFTNKDIAGKLIQVDGVDASDGQYIIRLKMPDANSPTQFGVGEDPDMLGVCLYNLVVVDEYFIEHYNVIKECLPLTDYNYFKAHQLSHKKQRLSRYIYELLLVADSPTGNRSCVGYCEACRQYSEFSTNEYLYAQGSTREQLYCKKCGLKNRQRILCSELDRIVGQKKDVNSIYIYEQKSKLFEILLDRYSHINVIGSEYLGEDVVPGTVENGIRHENALKLSFKSESIDVVVSCDVFEHVPDINLAFNEIYRVLSPGGLMIFTVPFNYLSQDTVIRVRLEDGKKEFLLPPVFHGNPIDRKGSLVFYDFGWDIITYCKVSGFSVVNCFKYWGGENGYLGVNDLFFFVAEK